MITLAISVLWLLIGLCILVGIGWVVLWVLGQLGIVVPPMVIKLALLILALLILIYFLTLLAGGGGSSLPSLGGGSTGHRSSVEHQSTTQFVLNAVPAKVNV